MTRFVASCVLAAGALVSVSAVPAAAADLGGGFTITGGATLVSDYRFRGISQTDLRPAVQGTFSIAHSSGFYATWWGSTIDDYIANGSDAENDFILGYRKTFGSTTVDGGVLYYYYPDHGTANTNFAEPYISVAQAFGPVTAKVTANYAPKQKALSVGNGSEDNFYLAGDLSYAVPKTPVSLTGHLGHTWGPSYLSIGDEYTDWNVGATVAHGPLTLGLAYVDTNKDSYSPLGRNISGSGVVASIGAAF
jgi:uncharacterized protein (TIGR02001 family)